MKTEIVWELSDKAKEAFSCRKYTIEDLQEFYKEKKTPDEIWLEYYDEYNREILVSNLGRIKFENKVQDLDFNDNGLVIIKKHGYRYLEVHRLVAKTWLKQTGNIVHHINKNPEDNRIENLIWVNEIQHGKIEQNFKK